MIRLLGYYGEIRSTALNKVYPILGNPSSIPLWHRWLIYGAGGAGVFITFMVLSWRNDCEESFENNILYKLSALMNLIYGFFEAFYPKTFWEFGGLVGLLVALTYFIYILLFKNPEISLI